MHRQLAISSFDLIAGKVAGRSFLSLRLGILLGSEVNAEENEGYCYGQARNRLHSTLAIYYRLYQNDKQDLPCADFALAHPSHHWRTCETNAAGILL
jgi:hypothetical protein